ncbi:MAG: hypothetical protein E7070_11915 [Bacteroidales bacterium]|jgi:hypothetical protein|nr:hypothetical protein [Bacteroidales bacterium]
MLKQKLILTILFSSAYLCASAQDVIVLRSGEIITCKVEEVTTQSIKYRKADNPGGPLYVNQKSEIISLRYANGTQEVLNTATADNAIGHNDEHLNPADDDAYSYKFRPEVRALFDPRVGHVDGGGGMQFVAGIQVGSRLKIGPGVGLQWHNFYDDEVYSFGAPIFLQARYDLTTSLIAPYIIGQVGYTFGYCDSDYYEPFYYGSDGYSYNSCYDNEFDLGPFFQCGIGIAGKLKRGRLFMDLSYKWQYWNSSHYTSPSMIGLSIGYVWVPRK